MYRIILCLSIKLFYVSTFNYKNFKQHLNKIRKFVKKNPMQIQKPKKQNITTKNKPTQGIVNHAPSRSLLETLDRFFTKYSKIFFWTGFGMTLLFALLLFDMRVSDGGDDSAYIVRAYEFIHHGTFPSFQGPLYPILLSFFVLIFGVKVSLLKLLSLASILGQYYFLHKAFNKRIPSSILYPALLTISVSTSLLYFSSQTYSEGFFMLLQSIFLWLVFKYLIDINEDKKSIKESFKNYIWLGLIIFSIIWTRNVGIGAAIALIGYLLLNLEWKKSIYTLGAIIAVLMPFEILKKLFFHTEGAQFSNQASGLMLKDFYNPAKGTEDIAGLFQRFIDNSNLYLSKHLFVFIGLKPEDMPQITPKLTILVYILVIWALISVIRKNKPLYFTILYTGFMSVVTFLAVQKHWDQPRLIIPYFPLLIISIYTGFYYLLQLKWTKKFQIIYLLPFLIIFFASFPRVLSKVEKHSKTLQANLSGNRFYGMTPDWVNFIKMSEWVAENIPEEDMVACRKPEISFVYSGRGFYGMYNVPTMDPDTFLLSLNKKSGFVPITANIIQMGSSPQEQQFHRQMSQFSYVFINSSLMNDSNQMIGNKVLAVYLVPEQYKDSTINLGNQLGIEFENDISGLIKTFLKDNWSFAIHNPDLMIEELRTNKIKYFILASLRKNPSANTGDIITTLHRFIYFVQLKYPNIYKEVHTIGTTEPATLIQINY